MEELEKVRYGDWERVLGGLKGEVGEKRSVWVEEFGYVVKRWGCVGWVIEKVVKEKWVKLNVMVWGC